MLQKVIFALLFALLPSLLPAQSPEEVQTEIRAMTKKEIRDARPTWLGISYGLDLANFRDMGTSPLFYTGTLQTVALGEIKEDATRFSSWEVRFTFGNCTALSGRSEVKSFLFNFSRLYQIPTRSWERWNLKVGGSINATGNQRINRSFVNSGQGLEMFANLLGSAKLQWDVSRREGKAKKFLFIKYFLPARKRNLSFQLNVGLWNNNFRSGYAYIGQSAALNTPRAYDGYEVSLFSGFRASSALTYTAYLNNGNGLRFSYLWDAYTSGGEYNQFAMAHHMFQFSFLFNTK